MAKRQPAKLSQPQTPILKLGRRHLPNRRGMLLYGVSYVAAAIFGVTAFAVLAYLGMTWTP